MSHALARLARIVEEQTGIRTPERQHPALLAALARAHPGTDPASFLRLTNESPDGQRLLARLVDEVTIKETSFLRDRRQLESIDWRALHERVGAIRVWCAACATGEEPYSLAMLAAEAFSPGAPPVDILATDISAAAIAAAERGVYRERAVRAVEPILFDRYFERAGNEVAVGTALRKGVRFGVHNLVRDPIPPVGERPFDLIVCRNVLIYFDSETTDRLVTQLSQAVATGGALLLGAADALSGATRRLARLTDEPAGQRRRAPEARSGDGSTTAADESGRPDARRLTAADPLNAELHFVRGLVELDDGDAAAAVWSLRRALFLDPEFGLAAFTLGRAHDALGDREAARRAYAQALGSLDPDDERYAHVHDQVDVTDVAAACTARLRALQEVP
ncbi:MAG TPA: CheR family methyltransferase [Gaiellaceae bacterium]|nr:CheR family methyltransferase [Gaiellaceae bacterium]